MDMIDATFLGYVFVVIFGLLLIVPIGYIIGLIQDHKENKRKK